MSKSDFPEFDEAYRHVLLPDDADRFNHIAADTRFNIYNSPIWRVQGRKFTEAVVRECIDCIRGAVLTDEVAVKNNLGFNDGLSAAVVNVQKHFGVEE